MLSTGFKYILSAAAICLGLASCSDEIDYPDYVTSGEEMLLTVPVSVAETVVQSRADLSDVQLNTVQSLWVATFSSVSGQMTSKGADGKTAGWVKYTATSDSPIKSQIQLSTRSGSSYIVAVANVEKMGVLSDAPDKPQPLSELLDNVRTWDEFLKVGVVAPSSYEGVNAPETPMAMCGAYSNTRSHEVAQWQNENVKPYTIPMTQKGVYDLTDGKIYLRRPVSQINFTLKSGNENTLRIVPNSYRVMNVPDFAWLYERPDTNFGDVCTVENKADYYTDSQNYSSSSSFIRKEADGSYTFDFWQAENKHTGTATNYKDREAQTSISETDGTNSGIFTALCPGGTWSSNNMASYVVVNCSVDYLESISVDDKGDTTGGTTTVWRSGMANYIIHLGYIDNIAGDFNCYRNVKYNYTVTVNGLNDIRVEAYAGEDTPGVEGIVTDVTNPTVNIDCHYAAFNVELTEEELSQWKETEGGSYTGFGFMIMTYDNLNGGLKEYDEVGLLHEYESWEDIPADVKKYIDWVEFRPTSDANVLAEYKPRNYADGKTFNLYDASKGITGAQKSSTNWYTCFVNEYTYEAANANETMAATGSQQPLWYSYVNADPRRFYIRVTRTISEDGESVYARSKYAVVQNSIQTYYGRQAVPDGTGSVKGAAMGFEAVNEVYGLNIRRSWTEGSAPDNGRYDCWRWASGKQWSACVDQTQQQSIPAGRTGSGIIATSYNVPKAANYTGNFSGIELVTNYDPQEYVTSTTSTNNRARTIEGINACMNRNRDNNGNGTIDESELRWYVPGVNQYTRITLGANSLGANALLNYADVSNCGYTINGTFSFGYDGRYLYYTSGGRVFWAMEGFAVSNWREWGGSNASSPGDPVAPWQVRCIRNLGTNLANVNQTSQAVKAYSYITTGTYHRVIPAYYELTNTRSVTYSSNGTGNGQMPVHVMSDDTYNTLYRGGFEILGNQDKTISQSSTEAYIGSIQTANPCSSVTTDGGRWRIPNATELAIMQNEGEFDVGGNYYVSCTVLGFSFGGIGPKVTDINASGQTLFLLNADSDRVTRSMRNTFYVRCVRDIIE